MADILWEIFTLKIVRVLIIRGKLFSLFSGCDVFLEAINFHVNYLSNPDERTEIME